jgi:hypothetical protein
MKKTKKIFMPKWQRWYVTPILVGIWVLITYIEFFSESSGDELGLVGYLIMTAVFIGAGVVTWLMTGGKLPVYVIHEEEDEDMDNV